MKGFFFKAIENTYFALFIFKCRLCKKLYIVWNKRRPDFLIALNKKQVEVAQIDRYLHITYFRNHNPRKKTKRHRNFSPKR